MAHTRAREITCSPFDRISIRDDDLALRPLDPADAAPIFRLIDADRERLGLWLPWVEEAHTAADSARFIADAAEERRRRRSLVLGIFVREAIAGTVGLHYIDWFDRCAELGYWIGSYAEGRGYVTRAARQLLGVAFGKFDLNRLVIRCAVDNERSRRVAQRLGFRCEGLLRESHWVAGRFLDQHLFALLRREHDLSGC